VGGLSSACGSYVSIAMLTTDRRIILKAGSPRGFSLIELLVTIGIIAVLASLAGGVWQMAVEKGAMAQDVAAGKTLIAAYQSYAAENGGQLMVGYLKGAAPVPLPDGSQISGEPANRYVWRLSPYFDYDINGVLYGKSRARAEKETTDAGLKGYGQSISVAYGINAYYVGGFVENGQTSIPNGDVATSLAQVSKPSSLLVFATAHSSDGPGHYIVKAPRSVPRAPGTPPLAQSDWPQNGTPEATGNVDFRNSNKALCAFLDGSLRSYDVTSLNDMRLWSISAARDDNPSYAPSMEGGSGGRGGR
jgi:prepilin-type N-terminal cleavage/methylation domain-containing protein